MFIWRYLGQCFVLELLSSQTEITFVREYAVNCTGSLCQDLLMLAWFANFLVCLIKISARREEIDPYV